MNQKDLQKPPFIDIPINKGTRPDWETRLGYPQILNLYVGESGFLYCTPGFTEIAPEAPLDNVRAIHYTTFDNGYYFVVTDTYIFRVSLYGGYNQIAKIKNSGKAVQIAENIQNQITFVDGKHAYVYDQRQKTFTILGENEGFTLTSPISVVVLNTITVILDADTNGWVISSTNNALEYPPLDNVPTIESQLTQAVGLETLGNNLYIFGSTGIERWEPNYNTNPYLFPFARDNNFRKDFGALSTNSIERGLDEIYFLSSKYVPMSLSLKGCQELGPGALEGMARIISQYSDFAKCHASFYTFRGNYFYHMTFPDIGISWVFNIKGNAWALSDDLILCALHNQEVVCTRDGVFQLGLNTAHKKRTWISERITDYKGLNPYRVTLNAFELQIIQGLKQVTEPQYIGLTISLDSQSWLNTVVRQIGLTGERKARTQWNTNLAATEFTIKADYYGDLDFTIERATAVFK